MRFKLLCLCMILFSYAELNAQHLVIHDLDESGNETGTRKFGVGDIVVIAHSSSGSNTLYFQGKITGIFKDRGEVRVLDFARSTRIVSVAGKKIDINTIVGVEDLPKSAYNSRELTAVGATTAGLIGAGIGGKGGNAVAIGAGVGGALMDINTRERMSRQNIKVDIEN